MAHTEKELSVREIFPGRVIDVKLHQVVLEDGKQTAREVVHHNGGACVAALDPEGNLLMVRQYRFAMGRELLELPAGKLEKGEDPAVAAARELEEETGWRAERLALLSGMAVSPGYCTETVYIYRAFGLQATAQRLDEGEFLSVERLPLQKAVQMVMAGEIADGKTQLGILMLSKQLQDEKEGNL